MLVHGLWQLLAGRASLKAAAVVSSLVGAQVARNRQDTAETILFDSAVQQIAL